MKKLYFLFTALILISCQSPESQSENVQINSKAPDLGFHPDWTAHSSIYEVNIRQHTPEGTIAAFTEKLEEVKGLGVNILWVMPIQPIGVKNRKGPLGSYYSISDYTAVNPEFGDLDDFKNMVNKAHDLGMKVILDWVANHSSFDNVWMEDHLDWYTQRDGKVVSPNDDWTDVADLNYDNEEMRKAMKEAMKFWVQEANIDGFRCDVAFEVPMDFWENTREALDSIKPVFMLAEAEGPEFHKAAFDMTYGWEFHHLMNEVASGNEELAVFDAYQEKTDSLYSKNDFRMFFTTNHDENSWNGTLRERMGDNAKNFFVLATTYPNGMPLIYSGQEYGLDKRLRFFDKDTIEATDSSLYGWYQSMINLKMTHPCLKMGNLQGDYVRITDADEEVFGYMRELQGHLLIVGINFGTADGKMKLPESISGNRFADVVEGDPVELVGGQIDIPGNSYVLLTLQE